MLECGWLIGAQQISLQTNNEICILAFMVESAWDRGCLHSVCRLQLPLELCWLHEGKYHFIWLIFALVTCNRCDKGFLEMTAFLTRPREAASRGSRQSDWLAGFFVFHCKCQVIRAIFPCNLSRKIVALQVAKLCWPYYHPRKQLVAQRISLLQVAATCCTK